MRTILIMVALRLNWKLGYLVIRGVHRRLLNLTNTTVLPKTCCFRMCCDSRTLENRNTVLRDKCPTFEEIISQRREQASRSFVVEALSKENFSNVCEICEKIGPLKTAFNYTLENKKEVFLVECNSYEMLQEVLKCCDYLNSFNSLPIQSRLLCLSSDVRGFRSERLNSLLRVFKPHGTLLCQTISAQMEQFYQQQRLTDLSIRLRFLICQQLEDALVGMFPHAQILPFGSSINGFGRNNCDLDMVLQTQNDIQMRKEVNRDLLFNTRSPFTNGRAQNQRILETIADLMKAIFPGITNVHKILHARIPIVEFYHSVMDVDCDLSYTNLGAVYMSELLHLYGELDSRVRPLVFTIRAWARASKVTRASPGHWISNFSLTTMVLFFLQNRPIPILPSLEALVRFAESDDVRITDGIDCTFQRKIAKIPQTQNSEDAGALLLEFFNFYSKFNFHKHALSLIAGRRIAKPSGFPLHIENPLEPNLNVSKNVSTEEMVHFNEAVRDAVSVLKSSISPLENRPWGIFNLFENDINASKSSSSKNGSFSVSLLFDESDLKSPQHVATADGQSSGKSGYKVTAKKTSVESQQPSQKQSRVVNVANESSNRKNRQSSVSEDIFASNVKSQQRNLSNVNKKAKAGKRNISRIWTSEW